MPNPASCNGKDSGNCPAVASYTTGRTLHLPYPTEFRFSFLVLLSYSEATCDSPIRNRTYPGRSTWREPCRKALRCSAIGQQLFIELQVIDGLGSHSKKVFKVSQCF